MAIHLPIGPLKTRSGLEQYRDTNSVPTSPVADDITTAPSGSVTALIDAKQSMLQLKMGYICHMTVCSYIIVRNYFPNKVQGRKEMFLFNNTLNILYLQLYGIIHMVEDHSDSDRGNLLPPHGLLFPISSKGSFICIITQTG